MSGQVDARHLPEEREDSLDVRLVEALERLIGQLRDVAAAAVVSLDGLTMASAVPDDIDEEHVGAMAAALLSLGEQAAVGLGRGQLRELLVDAEGGLVCCLSAGEEAVLLAVTEPDAKLGLVRYELRRAAADIADALAHASVPEGPSVPAGKGSSAPAPDGPSDTTPDASTRGLEEFAALADAGVRWRDRSVDVFGDELSSDHRQGHPPTTTPAET
ncbi:hypothetical protein ER308_19285 [Egibacter rhizosphaerae]|uniref:Roadblock/LAMTOR2 domain-containing protein n=1 Tax=Egibacter rhizosphaerae TaxID=1670831 RepID=A0A411YJY1_9ACTN|nr:roadblock/LC7 domain-containing protein [Egibacter rhizosphaerae]QBI21501.1 hypothetical protein ER308_19285 [Egibacter rhizosphaerae]